ncbi:ABC transporter [Colletotrichum asianum]|uniref:ABC transporter n=1 Tax=Colletotrichum asianum TaxID=702518 RepID=A0A8H3WCK2_9PEZI|nr:ABC transporter [Colletotrichum asianum]
MAANTSTFNIVIVGGGIAGLSSAIALRGPNRHITVLEQSHLNKEIGATISLQPNASKIVEKEWGLEGSLAKKGSMADKAFRIYDTDGKLHAEIPFHLKKNYGAERMVYHRVDLHDALKEAATRETPDDGPVIVRTGCVVSSCDPDAGVVKLESGEEIVGDLVVGADGIKSVLRQAVIGKEAPAIPTGLSAYRLIIDSSELEQDKDFTSVIDPKESITTMIMGHDRRIIMGPARNGSIYSIVAMVPDDQMQENAEGKSWTTKGDPEKLRETFKVFPPWARAVFKNCTEVGLWQLRDLDPLKTWHRGRTIIIGDASHPMLPTQGQGASQSVEDAEALGAIFSDVKTKPTKDETVFECRYDRATLIQGYSRQSGKPATDKSTNKITMNPGEFMDYNCNYGGARAWMEKQAKLKELAAIPDHKHEGAAALATNMTALSVPTATVLFETPLLVLTAVGDLNSTRQIAILCCQAVRLLAVLLLLSARLSQSLSKNQQDASEESQPFLRTSSSTDRSDSTCYGSVPFSDDTETEVASKDSDSDSDDDEDDSASIKRRRAKRLKETGGWLGYIQDFAIFLPYLIPKKDRKVQLSIFLCLLSIAGRRVLNVLIPSQLGRVTDEILNNQAPYGTLAIWLGLVILKDDAGLGLLDALAKIPIKQFSYRQVTNAAFGHVMGLSMEFHSERDSAEVMKAIEQGESLTNVLDTAVNEILPTVIDLFVAFWLLYWKFNVYLALAMALAAAAFMTLEVYTSSMNIKNKRASSKAEREEARVMHQAVQGWQTVTYFNMFGYEKRRFGQTVESRLEASRRYGIGDALVQGLLDMAVPLTFFVLASLVLREISQGRATAGDFVFSLQYWDYLVWPLKWLSHDYRYLMNDLVDAERLLNLLQTKSTIVEGENARELRDVKGHVEFEDVSFSYDPRRSTIQDLNISAAPGHTIALVGETGAGKSSIMKLLLRFYDVTSGRITIDGHDIRDITLSSLRDDFGVVPQDPLLFNATVMENLRYARPMATDEEIFDACRAAAIHDRILSFADGYQSRVGEQGVKLSGGEIQRLAIARVFLKDPPILILDEATSAVDTKTESSIQGALDVLKDGRTTFVIAHRLSTVVSADKIIVVHEGRVVESGTHNELLTLGGRYMDLWTRQISGNSEKATSL